MIEPPLSAMMPTVLLSEQVMAGKPLPPPPQKGGSYTLNAKGTAWLDTPEAPEPASEPDESAPSPTAPATEA